ncbi:formylglycine-generating enzyme family protein [bacterium]|nr:formylglycine-generating enzyme family protein [bacterium]
MKKNYLFAGLLIIALVCGYAGFKYSEATKIETAHYEKNELELIISKDPGYSVQLYQSGTNLEDVHLISKLETDHIWLQPGNYFLSAQQSKGPILLYPAPINGYKSGPDDDGALTVTIRSPKNAPPIAGEYVLIPSGNFLLGDRINPQEPHYVWLTSFYIGRFEVTNAEFRTFVNDPRGYEDPANWTYAGRSWKNQNTIRASAILGPKDIDYHRFGEPDQPVTNVSWYEASAYCQWLTRKIGKQDWLFSLPSEAEWEKAARGPDSFDFGLGMTLSDQEVSLYNWEKNPSSEVTVIGTARTKKKYRSNRFGLYHASGNVVEWTLSVFLPFNRNNPYDEYQRNKKELSGQRVARGGSWYSASIALLYLAYRDSFDPGIRNHDLGFRIVAKPLS